MEKNLTFTLLLGLILFISSQFVESKCTISENWVELTMEERLLMSDIVVYGKTKEHRANVKKIAGKSYYEIDAVFEVYCVLGRREDPVNAEILIERIAPRDGCSGTKDNMRIGEEAIVGLKASYDGKYEYDEVMPTQSASFPATKNNLFTLSSVCDLQSWSSPANFEGKCPICGEGNFTESAMALSSTSQPCFFDGINFNNTDCNLFASSSIDMDGDCIPEEYKQTCTRILFQKPTVTCECSVERKPRGQMNLGGLGEIDAAPAVLPGFMTIATCLLSVFMSL